MDLLEYLLYLQSQHSVIYKITYFDFNYEILSEFKIILRLTGLAWFNDRVILLSLRFTLLKNFHQFNSFSFTKVSRVLLVLRIIPVLMNSKAGR